jgi:hypothetical protein
MEGMPGLQFPDHRVLEVIVRAPGTMLDDIVLECPGLTWNQVFVVIDRLSREGVLTMSPKGRGQYAITFPTTDHTMPLTTSLCERVQVNPPAQTHVQTKAGPS